MSMTARVSPPLTTRHLGSDGKQFFTTVAFWDCECRHDYIHPYTEDSCPRCGAHREEQPDSIVSEVIGQLGRETWQTVTYNAILSFVSAQKLYAGD